MYHIASSRLHVVCKVVMKRFLTDVRDRLEAGDRKALLLYTMILPFLFVTAIGVLFGPIGLLVLLTLLSIGGIVFLFIAK